MQRAQNCGQTWLEWLVTNVVNNASTCAQPNHGYAGGVPAEHRGSSLLELKSEVAMPEWRRGPAPPRPRGDDEVPQRNMATERCALRC